MALAKQYGVSRGTVTKAMETLVRQGVLYRRRPQGTFVASSTLARLQRQHVPFVLIDRYVPEIDYDCVVSDMQPAADLG